MKRYTRHAILGLAALIVSFLLPSAIVAQDPTFSVTITGTGTPAELVAEAKAFCKSGIAVLNRLKAPVDPITNVRTNGKPNPDFPGDGNEPQFLPYRPDDIDSFPNARIRRCASIIVQDRFFTEATRWLTLEKDREVDVEVGRVRERERNILVQDL